MAIIQACNKLLEKPSGLHKSTRDLDGIPPKYGFVSFPGLYSHCSRIFSLQNGGSADQSDIALRPSLCFGFALILFEQAAKLDMAAGTQKLGRSHSLPCLMFMEASSVLDMLEHVAAIRILHCNRQVFLCEEDLLELYDVGMQHQAVIQDLSLHIPCDRQFSSLHHDSVHTSGCLAHSLQTPCSAGLRQLTVSCAG